MKHYLAWCWKKNGRWWGVLWSLIIGTTATLGSMTSAQDGHLHFHWKFPAIMATLLIYMWLRPPGWMQYKRDG